MQYFHCEDENALFVSLDQIHHIKGRSRNKIEELENRRDHLAAEAERFREENQQLQKKNQQLQKDNQQLRRDNQESKVTCRTLQEKN